MPAYLLDTNHIGMAVNRTSVVGQRIFEARLAGIRLGTCLPVLIMVAALARQMKLTILTTDGDFDALPDMQTADWSKP